jgi:predicted transposase YbfD/YdcC
VAFPPKGQADWLADARAATSCCKGHGRVERPEITTSTWLNDYLIDWPGVRQVFRLVRRRAAGGKGTEEVVYGITSLSRQGADAGRLLELSRAHWGIENGLHHTRDETLREDRCRVRRGQAARVLASLRNVAVYLLRQGDHPSVAAATREMAAHPGRALDLLDGAPSISE